MFKRQFNLFVLLFAFAFAQIGMVTHEISHYADASRLEQTEAHQVDEVQTQQAYQAKELQKQQPHQLAGRQTKDQDSLNKPCTTCLAYSAIGNGHLVNAFVFNVAVFEQHYFLADETAHFARHFNHYPARAPPTLV